MKYYLPENDLKLIFTNAKPFFEELRNSHIFLTGGTGFFGKWITYSILYANEKENLNIKVTIPSRNPEKFLKQHPLISSNQNIHLIKQSLGQKIYPPEEQGKVDYIIHAAANVITGEIKDTENFIQSELTNFQNILDFAKSQPIKKFLFTSSGAVYGKKFLNNANPIQEKDCEKNLTPYGKVKLNIESQLIEFSNQTGIPNQIVRCFAFIGPGAALDNSFAATSFIKQLLENKEIVINSSGRDLRSFLYMTDLVQALLKIISSPKENNIVNLGSDEEVSVYHLADRMKSYLSPKTKISILTPSLPDTEVSYYIPSISKARNIFNIYPTISLEESIKKTIDWYLAEEE